MLRKDYLKLIAVGILALPSMAAASLTPGYQARETASGIAIETPVGKKSLSASGDISDLSALPDYALKIPLKDFIPPAAPGPAPAAASGSPSVVVAVPSVTTAAPGNTAAAPSSPSTSAPTSPRLSAESHLEAANRLYYRGKLPEALAEVEEGLRVDPGNLRAWLMKGSLLHVFGQKDLAIAAWEHAREIEPQNPEVKRIFEELVQ